MRLINEKLKFGLEETNVHEYECSCCICSLIIDMYEF